MTMRTITTVIARLADAGITYNWQSGGVIRRVRCLDGVCREEPQHYSVQSVEHAAALDAWRVLGEGERLARRWAEVVGYLAY